MRQQAKAPTEPTGENKVYCDDFGILVKIYLSLSVCISVKYSIDLLYFFESFICKYLQKLRYIADCETRSLSNLLEHLCKKYIEEYKKETANKNDI